MKRACLVRQKFYPIQRNLRRNAETLVKEGYEVDVICVGVKGQSRRELVNGVNVYRIYFLYHRDNIFWYILDYLSFFSLASLQLAWLSLKRRYDVIEVYNIPDFHIFTTLFPKLLGSKIIFSMYEKTEALFATNFGLSRRHPFTRFINLITKIVTHYADHIIVTDVVVRKQLVDEFKISPDKTTLVINVPDESVFNLGLIYTPKDNRFFSVTIVSSILKRYGIQTMIQAVPILIKDIPELKVHIIGYGWYLPHLQRMSRELGIDSYINYTGVIPYEKVSSCIAQADVCVAPMIEDVGTPNKVLEYLAMGKATVSTDLPGLTALFENGIVSYFHPGNEEELAERILDLYRNPEKRAALGRAAKEFYNKHRWQVIKQAYLGIYKKLLG